MSQLAVTAVCAVALPWRVWRVAGRVPLLACTLSGSRGAFRYQSEWWTPSLLALPRRELFSSSLGGKTGFAEHKAR